MRQRFEQQIEMGQLLIQDTIIPKKCKHALVDLMAALKLIFITPKYNEQIFSILEKSINSNNNNTGRKGMNLWQIFVLSQVRLCNNLSYRDLHYIANHDKLIRQLMGVEVMAGFYQIEFEYQNIYDNISCLDFETLKQINQVIVELGHDVFKKKATEALQLKTDSFVVESNVHFPTDYNLLWDCIRKCLDGIQYFLSKYSDIEGWRKIKNWRQEIKGLMREVGKTSASGGKNKENRERLSVEKYLTKVNLLLPKVKNNLSLFPVKTAKDLHYYFEIEHFLNMAIKHVDLLERRVLKNEKIPHSEKMFSVFETYTEMINKGKKNPSVELGKKLGITTDQFNLIVDYQIMSHQEDREVVLKIADVILPRFNVESWSFDKGYWNKDNKSILQLYVQNVIMPKLGKRNSQEYAEEHSPKFIKFKNKHSAVESNINELEHRGLDICPDKGLQNFTRYISLAITAYNLRKIGKKIIEIEQIKAGLKTAA